MSRRFYLSVLAAMVVGLSLFLSPAARVSAEVQVEAHSPAHADSAAHPDAAAAGAQNQGEIAASFAAGEHGAAHDGAAAQGEAHAKPGLIPDPTAAQPWLSALWVVIIFLVLLAVLYPTAWKQVLAGLKKREQRIRQDIADAEAARGKAEATLREYNARLAQAEQQGREIIGKATADAERAALNIRTKTQQEIEEAKESATRSIAAARNQAVAQIYEEAATLSTAIAEKILQRNLNAEDQRDLVNRSLEQLKSVAQGPG